MPKSAYHVLLPDDPRMRRASPMGTRERRMLLEYEPDDAPALRPTPRSGLRVRGRNQRRLRRKSGLPPRVSGRTQFDPTLLMLVNRTTFGFSRAAYDEADALGYEAYLDAQLDHEFIDDTALDARLTPFDTLTMSSQEIYDTYIDMQAEPAVQLIEATILRATFSRRQLFERMVQFWTDHFNIDMFDDLAIFFKTADDRDVIRQHALGKFPDLLNASARSGAMLWYLDNYRNFVGHAQENYARELMELHTLGVDNGYTQQDVEEVARCFTGWTIQDTPNFGQFIFHPPFHDFGEKTVLGQVIPAGGGESDGQAVLDILAFHPNTARFLARKLAVRFLGYDPPEDVVETAKDAYLATGGDIKAVLRVILQPQVITYLTTPKLKRPFHMVSSLFRAAEADVVETRFLPGRLFAMGHAPFLWPTPDGYPDTLGAWATSVLPRWQVSSLVFDGEFPGVSVDPDGLLASEAPATGEVAAAIDRILTGGAMSDEEVLSVQQFHDGFSAFDPRAAGDAFGVASSMAGFQWY